MIWKLSGDVFLAGVDMATWPINTGETLIASNSRGVLAVIVRDKAGKDVSAQALAGSPAIDGTRVVFMLDSALPVGVYAITVHAPTSDDEMLTEQVPLTVR